MEQKHTIAIAITAALASTLLGANGVLAVDGVRLLRQQGTFPIEITKSGSYRLRGPLTVPNANTTAILIKPTATDVTIDLNGFAISGPTDCPGTPGPSCTPTGTGYGIATECTTCPLQGSLVIRDGFVRGMGSDGIRVEVAQVRIERVSLHDNGGNGVTAKFGAVLVRDSFASTNGGTGFYLSEQGVITGSVALANGSAAGGIFLEGGPNSGFVAVNNVSSGNEGDGIVIDGPTAVVRSSVANRNVRGISVVSGESVVEGNVVSLNLDTGIKAQGVLFGNVAAGNDGHGIDTHASVVSHNLAFGNTLLGMDLDNGAEPAGASTNVLSANNGGLGELSGGVELGGNLCGVDMSCP